MRARTELHKILCGTLGSKNCYFQPPETVKMKYPCIVYSTDRINNTFADDYPYINKKRYSVTVIDPDPDSDIPNQVAQIPSCQFDRFYISDNLNHFVFTLYF